jgi:hypothetical protein
MAFLDRISKFSRQDGSRHRGLGLTPLTANDNGLKWQFNLVLQRNTGGFLDAADLDVSFMTDGTPTPDYDGEPLPSGLLSPKARHDESDEGEATNEVRHDAPSFHTRDPRRATPASDCINRGRLEAPPTSTGAASIRACLTRRIYCGRSSDVRLDWRDTSRSARRPHLRIASKSSRFYAGQGRVTFSPSPMAGTDLFSLRLVTAAKVLRNSAGRMGRGNRAVRGDWSST